MRFSRFMFNILAVSVLIAGSQTVADAQQSSKSKPGQIPRHATENQDGSLHTRETITREQADAILAELRAIRELLQKQGSQDRLLLVPTDAPPANKDRIAVQVRVANHWHSLGREDAPITLLEFSDYQCPFCRTFHAEIFPEIKKQYIDSGKMRFISLDLPLPQHQQAQIAAEAARCAGDQGKYWELRSALLADQSSHSEDIIASAGSLLSLDVNRLRSCISSQQHKNEIQEDAADADSLQINGTPTFILGKTIGGSLEGTLLTGVMPYPVLQTKID